MSKRPDLLQTLYKLNEHAEENPTDIYKYRPEEKKLNELEPQLVPRKCTGRNLGSWLLIWRLLLPRQSCSKTIKTLEIDLRDAKAINNASLTSAHAEADRMKKEIAKATADLEARLNESEYNNQGLERKCRMFEDRYPEQVIASAKKEEQLIRRVVEERRSHDRVLELHRDLEKEENRFFESELAFQNVCHKFGVDRQLRGSDKVYGRSEWGNVDYVVSRVVLI
ncbi:hypothetical protein BPAE_0276g00030 [Botrytis paeoniae]|uniref:Uncharacterized protein n=1 Tax=Botrytis paeoniae TaxID=278948 RepID=A0A4Z1FBH3_9HELO|nr:hypothetical protein BPAE_0276g00030 [Botrytis paeoniae]